MFYFDFNDMFFLVCIFWAYDIHLQIQINPPLRRLSCCMQLSPKYRDLCDKQHYLHLKLWRNLYLHVLCKWWKNYQFKLITDQSVLFCSGEALVVRIDLIQTGYKFNDNLYNSRSGPHNAQKRNRAQGELTTRFLPIIPMHILCLKKGDK